VEHSARVRVDELCVAFGDWIHKHELANLVKQCATHEDIPALLGQIRKRRFPVVREACAEALAGVLSADDSDLLSSFAESRRAFLSGVFESFAVRTGEQFSRQSLVDMLGSAEDWKCLFAIHALGARGDPVAAELSSRVSGARRRRLAFSNALSKASLRLALTRGGTATCRWVEAHRKDVSLLPEVAHHHVPGLPLRRVLDWFTPESGFEDSICHLACGADAPVVRGVLRKLGITYSTQDFVEALGDHGSARDFDFIVGMVERAVRAVEIADAVSVLRKVATLAVPRHLPRLRRALKKSEFWKYVTAPSPDPKQRLLPGTSGAEPAVVVDSWDSRPTYATNAYQYKRLVAFAFARLAGRRDLQMLLRMMNHDYRIVRYAAAEAVARLCGERDIPMLMDQATGKQSQADAAIMAINLLDRRLYGRFQGRGPRTSLRLGPAHLT
jgi:hypothetical protein